MIFSVKHSFIYDYVLLFILVLCVFGCNKEKQERVKEIVYPLTSDGNFVEAAECDEVSIFIIKAAAKSAGLDQFSQYLKYSIKLYTITYRTTYKGKPILASGLIAYPVELEDSISSVFVGNGLTFADDEAPSAFQMPDNYTGFEFIASFGYFTLIPDMIGYGVSKGIIFPVHNYEHSANTMIDMIHAGREFIKAKGLKVNQKAYMAGYSQGAYVVMSALKMIEEKPVSDIKIEASSVGAGGYNLLDILNDALSKNTYSSPSHLILLFSSFNEIYDWNRPMTDFFQDPYASKIPELLSGKYDRNEINSQLAYRFDSLFNPVFLSNLKTGKEPDVIRAFEKNNVDNWTPHSLLNIMHSVNDDRISITDSENAYYKMRANGSTSVIFTPLNSGGHVDSGFSFVEETFNWFKSIEK